MAENSSNGTTASKTQAKRATTEAKKSAAKTAKATKKAATKTAVAEKNQAQVLIESVVDFPVGAVLSVSDRVGEIVEPWTSRDKAEKELKAYRRKIEKAAKRTERRGTTARKRATTEARKTRKAVERDVRKRQKAVTSTATSTFKTGRDEVERRVKQVSEQLSAIR
jgi:F0F1-type ATP synthase membrane subunit b/b'